MEQASKNMQLVAAALKGRLLAVKSLDRTQNGGDFVRARVTGELRLITDKQKPGWKFELQDAGTPGKLRYKQLKDLLDRYAIIDAHESEVIAAAGSKEREVACAMTKGRSLLKNQLATRLAAAAKQAAAEVWAPRAVPALDVGVEADPIVDERLDKLAERLDKSERQIRRLFKLLRDKGVLS